MPDRTGGPAEAETSGQTEGRLVKQQLLHGRGSLQRLDRQCYSVTKNPVYIAQFVVRERVMKIIHVNMPSILKNGKKKPLQIHVSPTGRLITEFPPFHSTLSDVLSVQLFETPWTAARQAPLSMGFSKAKQGGQWGLQSPEWQEMVPWRVMVLPERTMTSETVSLTGCLLLGSWGKGMHRHLPLHLQMRQP